MKARFTELLTVKSKQGQALATDEYQINLLTNVGNEGFAKGFSVFLKGNTVKESSVKNNSFRMDKLHPGIYDLRVQRDIKFELVRKAKTTDVAEEDVEENGDVEAEDESEAPKSVDVQTKLFCAKLYADEVVEINAGQRTENLVIDHFSLELRNERCSEESDYQTITP